MRAPARPISAGCLLLLFACADASDPLAPPAPAFATGGDLVVNALDDVVDADGCTPAHCSLREAVQGAAAGQTIGFAVTGTIRLQPFAILLERSVTIAGPGAAALTIEGGSLDENFGILDIGPDADVSLSGVRLTGGRTVFPGGALRVRGTLTADGLLIEGNRSRRGGGLHNIGTVTLRNSVLRDNVAAREDGDAQAGAILNAGTFTAENIVVTDNRVVGRATEGGAIFNAGTLVVRDSRIAGNLAEGPSFARGGGVSSQGADASLTIERTAILDNRVLAAGGSASGGGIAVGTGLLLFRNGAVERNTAVGVNAVGGGVEIAVATASLENAVLRDNAAHGTIFGFGGAIFNGSGAVALRHVTVTRNEVIETQSQFSGAVQAGGVNAVLRIIDSVIAGNILDPDRHYDLTAFIAAPGELRGSIIGTLLPQATVPDASNTVGFATSPATVAADLGFVEGPVLGYVPTYLVQAGSPAIDAGVADGCIATDLLGTTRPQGPACDAGAVEYAAGGFVSGSGWIGADGARITFGFIVRPPKRDGAPSGELQLVLHDGVTRLHSTAFRGLLVNGGIARIEGDGRLDGDRPVSFSVTVIDGSPDRIAIRIADAATGDVLLDTGEHALGGGSIVVHRR